MTSQRGGFSGFLLMPPTPDFPDFCGFLIFLGGFWGPGGVPAARPQNSASGGLRESPAGRVGGQAVKNIDFL